MHGFEPELLVSATEHSPDIELQPAAHGTHCVAHTHTEDQRKMHACSSSRVDAEALLLARICKAQSFKLSLSCRNFLTYNYMKSGLGALHSDRCGVKITPVYFRAAARGAGSLG